MRYYEIRGNKYPSVTSILGDVLPKPWLVNYIKAKSREALWDMVNSRRINYEAPKYADCHIHTGGKRDRTCEFCLQEMESEVLPLIEISDIQYCLDAHKRHSEKALNIGSLVHSAIEVFLKEWDLNTKDCPIKTPKCPYCYVFFLNEYYPQIAEIFDAFARACDNNVIEVLESEQTVWHPMGYAGTLDLICEMDSKLWIGDIKTFTPKSKWKAYKKGKERKRAFRIADTEEDLMEILEDSPFEFDIVEVLDKKPLFKKEHYAQTEAYRRAYNNISGYVDKPITIKGLDENDNEIWEEMIIKEDRIKNRFILWLDKRQQDNYYLEIIEESDNEKHWDMWCTAFNQWRAWK